MIRLFVSCDLSVSDLSVLTDNQAHYLLHVMRLQIGDKLSLFNGKDGEWLAEIKEAGKRGVKAECLSLLRPQEEEPTEKPTLYFAPIKKEAMAFLVQKATELGVGTLCPVITQRTVAPMPKADKIRLQAIEAAEQSERLSVPTVCPPIALRDLLKSWANDCPLIYLNERGETDEQVPSAASFLIGPEGGFTPEEITLLEQQSFTYSLHLGRRILRAETASLVALTLWNQAHKWKK